MGKHMGTWGTYAENAARIAVLSLSGVMLVSVLAACKTPEPIVAPAHMPHPQAQIVGPRPVSDNAVSQRRDTGTYPSFSAPMTAAGSQMGDDEASKMESNLSRLALHAATARFRKRNTSAASRNCGRLPKTRSRSRHPHRSKFLPFAILWPVPRLFGLNFRTPSMIWKLMVTLAKHSYVILGPVSRICNVLILSTCLDPWASLCSQPLS